MYEVYLFSGFLSLPAFCGVPSLLRGVTVFVFLESQSRLLRFQLVICAQPVDAPSRIDAELLSALPCVAASDRAASSCVRSSASGLLNSAAPLDCSCARCSRQLLPALTMFFYLCKVVRCVLVLSRPASRVRDLRSPDLIGQTQRRRTTLSRRTGHEHTALTYIETATFMSLPSRCAHCMACNSAATMISPGTPPLPHL